jgi:methyltransferase
MLIFNTILVGALIVQRLVELRVSKGHQRRLSEAGAESLTDPVFPWMVLTHAILISGCLLEPWWFEREFVPFLGWSAFGALIAAEIVRVWVLRSLGRHWNVRIIASGAEGIVTTGPYRLVRHPNYAVVLVEALALPLFHGAYLTLLVVQILHVPVLIARIRDEERYLMSLEDYRERMADKPRFIPRIRRRPESKVAR